MARTRKWRKFENRPGRWRLVAGSRDNRSSVALGAVTEDEAERARDNMTRFENEGLVEHVLLQIKEDRESALLVLMGDAAVASIVQETPRHYLWTLERYVNEVLAPHRSGNDDEGNPICRGWEKENLVWKKVLPVLGSTRIGEVTPLLVHRYLDGLRCETGPRKGKALGGNTKRIRRAVIQSAINHAYERGHLHPRIYLQGQDCPRLSSMRLKNSTKRVTEKPVPLTLEELAGIMEVSTPMHRCMWAVGAGQGLRPSELTQLNWGDIDWDDMLLTVRGTKTRDSDAVIAITPLAMRELRRYRDFVQERIDRAASSRGTKTVDARWLAPFHGRSPLEEDMPIFTFGGKRIVEYKHALKTAAKAAGIKRRVWRYLLRHSFATIAWTVGIEKESTRTIGRWKDYSMLDEVYRRPRPKDVVPRLAAFDFAPGSVGSGG